MMTFSSTSASVASESSSTTSLTKGLWPTNGGIDAHRIAWRTQICRRGPLIHIGPDSCAVAPEVPRRSVDRGRIGQPFEPRKFPILSADTAQKVEGNTFGRFA